MWKDTLRKMPMPMNVATGRDEDYKQKIIAYEKKQIEPAFTKYTQGLVANAKLFLAVEKFRGSSTDFRTEKMSGEAVGIYRMGTDVTNALGGDFNFILNTIKELYDKEGYFTQIEGDQLFIKNK